MALIPGLAAREVAVNALGTVYAMSGSEEAVTSQLSHVIAAQCSMATAFALLAWYEFAPQCLATVAVIRREISSWSVNLVATLGWFLLAYFAALYTYRVALAVAG